jgi:hypothetical protein
MAAQLIKPTSHETSKTKQLTLANEFLNTGLPAATWNESRSEIRIIDTAMSTVVAPQLVQRPPIVLLLTNDLTTLRSFGLFCSRIAEEKRVSSGKVNNDDHSPPATHFTA